MQSVYSTAPDMNADSFAITEIGFQQKLPSKQFVKEPKVSGLHKVHVNSYFHFCCKPVQNSDILVLHCSSDWMMADIMIKALPRTVFEHMQLMMVIVPEQSYTIPIKGKG